MVNSIRQLNLDELCIHQVCLYGQCNFEQSLIALQKNQVKRTALWNPMIDAIGEQKALKLWNSYALTAESLCAAELFAGAESLKWMLERADKFGARTLVLVTGGIELSGMSDIEGARRKIVPMLARADEISRDFYTNFAFEPLHPMVCGNRSVVSNLSEVISIFKQLDETHNIGLVIDTYALWWENRLAEKILNLKKFILNYHVSDWLLETKDVRLDRGMPGDGIIKLIEWRKMLQKAGFLGPVEIEIFSKNNWWNRNPDVMLQQVISRMNKYF